MSRIMKKEKMYRGYKYYIILREFEGVNFYVGYVVIPKDNKLYMLNDDHELLYGLDVHGGITYSYWHIEDHSEWVIGFDCGHYLDDINKQTMDYTENECRKLIDQIIEINVAEGKKKSNKKYKSEDGNIQYRNLQNSGSTEYTGYRFVSTELDEYSGIHSIRQCDVIEMMKMQAEALDCNEEEEFLKILKDAENYFSKKEEEWIKKKEEFIFSIIDKMEETETN